MDLPALGTQGKPSRIRHLIIRRIRHSPLLHRAYHASHWLANCALLTSVSLNMHVAEPIIAGILVALIAVGLLIFKETNL